MKHPIPRVTMISCPSMTSRHGGVLPDLHVDLSAQVQDRLPFVLVRCFTSSLLEVLIWLDVCELFAPVLHWEKDFTRIVFVTGKKRWEAETVGERGHRGEKKRGESTAEGVEIRNVGNFKPKTCKLDCYWEVTQYDDRWREKNTTKQEIIFLTRHINL